MQAHFVCVCGCICVCVCVSVCPCVFVLDMVRTCRFDARCETLQLVNEADNMTRGVAFRNSTVE